MCWGLCQQTRQIWAHLDSGSESLDLTPVTGESGGNAQSPEAQRSHQRDWNDRAGEFVMAILRLPSSGSFVQRQKLCTQSGSR